MFNAEENNSSRAVRILISVAAIVIIIVGINLAQSIVVLFLVSFFLALLAYVLSFIPEFIEYRFRAVLPVEFDFAIALFKRVKFASSYAQA